MTTHSLYGGEVKLVFDPDAPRYRYKVTDLRTGIENKPVRGVTTLLRDVLHKPELLMWPMNEALTLLFGQEFDSKSKSYVYKPSKALLKPERVMTQVELQNALDAARKAHTAKSDRGKDVGSMVHENLEAFLTGQPMPEFKDVAPEDVKAVNGAVNAFIDWWKSLRQAEVISVETPIYSRSLWYAGTYDLKAKINGKVYMLDFKTTNRSRVAPLGIYAEYFLQLGAYSYAETEENGGDFDDLGVINVSKTGSGVHIACASDMGLSVSDCEDAFAFGVKIHDWLEATTKLTKDSHFTSHLNRTVA